MAGSRKRELPFEYFVNAVESENFDLENEIRIGFMTEFILIE